jgi:hypothetical protein
LYVYSNGGATTKEIAAGTAFGTGLVVDNSGDVFVTTKTSFSSGTIQEFKAVPGSPLTYASPITFASFADLPEDLAYDPGTGDVYLTYNNGSGGGGTLAFSPTGSSLTPLSTSYSSVPTGIAFASPEPGTVTLMFGGLLGFTMLRRRKSRT